MSDPMPTLSHNTETFERDVRTNFDRPIFTLKTSAGSESANKRRITLQAIDRRNRSAGGVFSALVWLTDTAGGSPSSTGNTVAFASGTVVMTMLPNGAWLIQTDSEGSASFDLTIAGAATRYVESVVLGKVKESDAITWT